MTESCIIYVLKLEDDKYYVGRTNDLHKRLNEHQSSTASAWTKKYKMTDVEEVYKGDVFDEEKYVIKYMAIYGIDNVRGGSYSNLTLTRDQYLQVKKSIANAENKCFICDSKGHFAQNCVQIICYRCGRCGHKASDCYAKSHILNANLNGCYRCGRQDHWAVRCLWNTDIYGRPLDSNLCNLM